VAAARETVLVTGSSGFIGRAVVMRLAERYAVVGLDRDQPPHPLPTAESLPSISRRTTACGPRCSACAQVMVSALPP